MAIKNVINIIEHVMDEQFWVYNSSMDVLRFHVTPENIKCLKGILINTGISDKYAEWICNELNFCIQWGIKSVVNGYVPHLLYIIPTNDMFKEYDFEKYQQILMSKRKDT